MVGVWSVCYTEHLDESDERETESKIPCAHRCTLWVGNQDDIWALMEVKTDGNCKELLICITCTKCFRTPAGQTRELGIFY